MTRIIELTAGAARARLAPELGGRVTALRLGADGRDVLFPFPEDTAPDALLHWPKGGIYPLLPYGNRIRGARLRLPGREVALRAHPDAAPHTLHGHGHRRAWTVADARTDAALLTLDHPGDDEWPWAFGAEQEVVLREDSLRIGLRLRNASHEAMPAGIGVHPYLLHRPGDRLRFAAGRDWPTDADMCGLPPVPCAPRCATPRYAKPGPLPPGGITWYRSAWDGKCEAEHPAGVVALAAAPAFGHLVVHRPEGGAYLCLEPTSHAADGFNLAEDGVAGTGRVLLGPGEVLAGDVTFTLRQHDHLDTE